jgi:hypothetical protein
VKRIISAVLLILFLVNLGLAEETSFQRVKMPDPNGRQTKAVLTFSDNDKAIEVRPAKGDPMTIPYVQIDTFSYEYTRKHRIKQGAIVMLASIAAGAIVMMTKSRSHWLEIDYHDQEVPKAFVVRMDKHDYIHILDAVKSHTGKDAEILGNADKRKK